MRVVFAVLFCVTSATSASACGVCSALPTYLQLCSLRKFYAPAMFTLGSLTVTTLPWWFESGNHNWAIYFGPISFWARFLCRICKKCVHDEFSVFSVLCCMTRFAGAEVRRGRGKSDTRKAFPSAWLLPISQGCVRKSQIWLDAFQIAVSKRRFSSLLRTAIVRRSAPSIDVTQRLPSLINGFVVFYFFPK